MGGKKDKQEKVVVAEFTISMHCNACETRVAKAISKIKGVEEFMTDMINHKVIITGKIDPQKVVKKLKKKTGKKVELLVIKDDTEDEDRDEDLVAQEIERQRLDSWLIHYYGSSEIHMLFNDDNANACSIM